jgi:alkylation response protein AidB-like acyl-CoA dehydrogenase
VATQNDAQAVELAVDELAKRYPGPSFADPVAFLAAQFDLGLAWVHFAAGHGGLGVAREWQREVDRRLGRLGAPATMGDFVAVHQMAATIEALGTTEQRRRFLRRIFTGEDHWCQLFSEPGAGSDLAGVATTAVQDGDEWIITGQKVWTSGARQATFGLALARTDPDVPKHRGLTMFIIDMRTPTVEVRPLRQADGGARFSEVFFSEARTPDCLRLGDVGDGWAVSLRVLQTERTGAADVFLRPIDDLLALWRRRRTEAPAGLRDEVVKLWIEAKVIGLSNMRRQSAPDGADVARLAALAKISASEHAQRLSGVMAGVLGPEGQVGIDYGACLAEDMADGAASPTRFARLSPPRFVLRSRAMSIEGGTNQIQRNIVGERVLGLPPDIRVDKDRAWRDVPRS